MSQNNGVVRIGRKGIVKFAFGDDEPFEVDVVTAFQAWANIDEEFRLDGPNVPDDQRGLVPSQDMPRYHQAAVDFVQKLATDPRTHNTPQLTVAEALDFLARLREQYDELVHFFRPKQRAERESPASTETALHFSVEEEN